MIANGVMEEPWHTDYNISHFSNEQPPPGHGRRFRHLFPSFPSTHIEGTMFTIVPTSVLDFESVTFSKDTIRQHRHYPSQGMPVS